MHNQKTISRGTALLMLAGILTVASVRSVRAADSDKKLSTESRGAEPVKWDDQESEKLAAALHHVHEVWNKGDIKTLKSLMVGDQVLATYELDPKDHQPVRLASKGAIDGFVDRVFNQLQNDNSVTELEKPVVHCRASGNLGVCTEECTIHVKAVNRPERVDKLWSTNVAVKYPDGWKWIQWQMSEARNVESAAISSMHEADHAGRPH